MAPALLQSSTFVSPVGSDEEVLYSRYGNNPNQVELARKYALLEGAEAAIFVASGMGATALAHLAMLRPGDHLIASTWIYGGTQRLFDEELARFGIEVTYVSPDHVRFVTYTTRYNRSYWVSLDGLEKHYERAPGYGFIGLVADISMNVTLFSVLRL